MKHTVDYSQLSEQQKYEKAINDCKSYLGDEIFEKVISILEDVNKKSKEKAEEKAEEKIMKVFALHLSFIGIEGYPVKAIYRYINESESDKG